MTFDDFLANVKTEPCRTLEQDVRIASPERLAELHLRGGMRMTELLSDPRHTVERRTLRRGHVLGPGATPEALLAWQRRWPRHPLPHDLAVLLARVNGIHLWADLDDGRAYEGLAPLEEWDEVADPHERLVLQIRSDAKVVLVCEKKNVEAHLDEWHGPSHPSVAHVEKLALAWFPPLASRWTARLLTTHARAARAPLAFFGDLDPQSLHAFAALRAGGRRALLRGGSPQVPVRWVGLETRWLDWTCKARGVQEVPQMFTIQLSWLDQEYWELVKLLVPDVRALIGKLAYQMLERGTKLEADALLYVGPAFVEELGRRVRLVTR